MSGKKAGDFVTTNEKQGKAVRMNNIKKTALYIFFLTNLALFTLFILNLISIPVIRHVFFNPNFREDSYDRFWVEPSADPDIIQQVYPGEAMDVIRQKKLANQPMIHTVVENTSTPMRSTFVNVGIEGIRYFSGKINEKILKYYQANIAFVKDLARGIGFDVHFFYQPLGMVDPNNPFLKSNWSEYSGSRIYRQFSAVQHFVRQAIAEDRLDMIDLSDCLQDLKQPRYVDTSHYTKYANERIADAIFRHTHGCR